jgi:hypothetical protein
MLNTVNAQIRSGSSPYKAKKKLKMEVSGIFVKQFFSKMIVEKNKAMAVFQSIYGIYIYMFSS